MYKVKDYLQNGMLYLNNIARPRHKKLSQLMLYSTTNCQSRCKHCSIWKKPEEYMRGVNGYDNVIDVVNTIKDEVAVSLMFCLSPWNNFNDMDYVIRLATQLGIDVRIGIYDTMFLLLSHANATGVVELSTAYTWSDAQESLTVNARKGTYEMKQLDSITFKSKPATLLGVPLEIKPLSMP